MFDKILSWLTSNYDKTFGSKIYGVVKIFGDELEEVNLLYKKIEDWTDIDSAEGKALDQEGQNLLQFRGEVTDDIYRVLIRSKIARNRSTGTYNSMIEVLALSLGVEYSEIVIEEGTGTFPSISVIQLPLVKLSEIGMSSTQFGRIVAQLVAAGVKLESVEFYGTFEFVDVLSNDLNLGYSDVLMTQGGTYGDLYQPATDPDFPL